MHVLGLPQLRQLAPAAPLVARLLVGTVMTAHGWQKLTEMTPAGPGQGIARPRARYRCRNPDRIEH